MTETTDPAAARPATTAKSTMALPEIRAITVVDLVEVFGAGIQDMRRAPVHSLFFGLSYAVGGWLILLLLWKLRMPYLAYPMAMGFALIAPFVATGLYDVSRRLETDTPVTWRAVLSAPWLPQRRDLRWMALITGFALVLWMDIAAILSFGFLGFQALTADLVNELFTTPSGLLFLAIGNLAGAIIAFSIFSISVISFPLLYDRDLDFVTAMVASVKTVSVNPRTMAVWAIVIGALTALSIVSLFVGLIVVLPVLGHASWHLYRRVIGPPVTS